MKNTEFVVINQSWPWKKELERLRRSIDKAISPPASDDFDDFKLEKPLFYSAFVMRKLIENWKITDAIRDQTMAVEEFRANEERIGVLRRMAMRGNPEVEFNLEEPAIRQINVWDLSSEIIHSGYLFWWVNDDGAIDSVLLCSFRNEKRRIIRFALPAYLALIDSVVNDDIQSASQWIDEHGKLHTELR